jgi:protein-S-isoprenylcysteine O-methyltransferase Ste14
LTPSILVNWVWGSWVISWVAAALWTSLDKERKPLSTNWSSYALIILSIAFPVGWHILGWTLPRAWDVGSRLGYTLALATIPGFALSWWARIHLGRLWSAEITRKVDHRVIETGPYSVARHPIYTGILWAALCTDAINASLPGLVSFGALTLGLGLKARDEERFLSSRLPAFEDYKRRVPMLFPLPWARSGKPRQHSSTGPS